MGRLIDMAPPGRSSGRGSGRGRGGRGRSGRGGRSLVKGGRNSSIALRHPHNGNKAGNIPIFNSHPQSGDTAITAATTSSVDTSQYTTSTTNDVSTSMKDVNSKMELLNNTIGTTLSSQLLSNKSNNKNERCQTCIATTASLAELQQQVQIAMKRVEKMNASLSVLQTHSNLVQQSLATISSHALLNSSGSSPVMNGTHLSPPPEIVSTAPSSAPSNLVTPAAAADHQGGAKSLAQSSTINVEDHKSTLAQRQEQILKRGTKILESNKWGSTPPIGSTAQEEKPKSFRELMMEKRKKTNDSSKKQSATVVSNVEGGDATRKEKKIVTLGDLITSCAPYLTGSSSEYADWLREELDISTISDLAEAVEECPELLIAGNGTVGMWQKHKFSDAVKKAAASCSSTTTSKPSSSSAAVTKEDDSFKSCQSSEGGKMAMLQQRIASRKAAAQSSTTMGKSSGSMTGGDWTCSVCTCINPKLYLSCSACGSANSSDAKEDGKSITPPGTSAATNTAATSQFSFNTPFGCSCFTGKAGERVRREEAKGG